MEKNPEKRPRDNEPNTANYRGYVGIWEIKDSTLWLNDVKITKAIPKKRRRYDWITLSRHYEVTGNTVPVKAEWFSGAIQVPKGALEEYIHMGYASTYEKYLLITFDKGKIVSTDMLTADELHQV